MTAYLELLGACYLRRGTKLIQVFSFSDCSSFTKSVAPEPWSNFHKTSDICSGALPHCCPTKSLFHRGKVLHASLGAALWSYRSCALASRYRSRHEYELLQRANYAQSATVEGSGRLVLSIFEVQTETRQCRLLCTSAHNGLQTQVPSSGGCGLTVALPSGFVLIWVSFT